MPPIFRDSRLLAFALLAITALVYWPGLSGGFLFDDYPNIVTNPRIQIDALGWEALRGAAEGYRPGPYGRPLATISFAVNYVLGGKDPWGYKLAGLMVHLANALLVFWLSWKLLGLPRVNVQRKAPIAFAVALLWAIHPIQVSSVLYVVQRMETLSTTFVLLALIAYLHGRILQRDGRPGWHWLALSTAFACIGMLSKESAILFPAYTLAMELTVLGFATASPATQRWLTRVYLAGAAIGLAIFVAWALPKAIAPHAFDGRDFTLYERLLTQMRVLPMYLGQMLLPLPAHLTFYYDALQKSVGWLHPATTLAGAALLLALLFAAWCLRRRFPLASLGILWFFAAHLITSNVFNLELAFEHRNYFGLLGVLLTLADLIKRIPMRDGPALKQVAICTAILAFGMLCLMRSATWGNPLNLAMELVDKNPHSARASIDLGEQYMILADGNAQSPFYSMGIGEFERGARIHNSSPLPEQALILFSASMGQPVRDEWWQGLTSKLRVRPIGPQEQLAVSGLLEHRYDGIELDDRRLAEAYTILASRAALPPHVYARLGDHALHYLNDQALADRMFVTAIESNPTDRDSAAKIFATLTSEGNNRQAKAVFERARDLGLMTDTANASTSEQAVGH